MSGSIKLSVFQNPARQTNTDFRILIPSPRIFLALVVQHSNWAWYSYFTGFCYGDQVIP